MHQEPAVIVFSHLRWDSVYQRPHHLISRLAARRRVFFIEEPIHDPSSPGLGRRQAGPRLTVCTPRVRFAAHWMDEGQIGEIRPLVENLVREEGLREYVLWFYSPMALPLADSLRPLAIAYDCMDELSAFLHAPPPILEREAALLDRADIVFTGGRSLYRAKKGRHPYVHCFPSSVDRKHFARGREGGPEADDQVHLPHPRMGFFGVIDERLDVAIIEAVARARPDWQLVMVGPVVKIDPAILPKDANIHWLGQRSYADLPLYLAGWDVALLPFAHNDATRFISPTKTLEYMAAERPIVSTSIRDVAEAYGDIVYLGDGPAGFLAACDRALESGAEERRARVDRMRAILAGTSWDVTANRMGALLDEVSTPRGTSRPPSRKVTAGRAAVRGDL